MKAWRRLSSVSLVNDRWLRLRADECELPNGKTLNPYYVLDENDWVHVFALAPDGKLLTVTQFRYAGNATCLELPGGAVETSEPPLDAARRELLEETGFEATIWTLVASVFANPARQTNRIHLAEELNAGGAQRLDDSEEIEHQFMDSGAVKVQIAAGVFSQSLHIASFFLCLDFLADRRRSALG